MGQEDPRETAETILGSGAEADLGQKGMQWRQHRQSLLETGFPDPRRLCASGQAERPKAQAEAQQAGAHEILGVGMRAEAALRSPGSTTMSPGGLWSSTETSRTGSLEVSSAAGTVGR